MSIWTEPSRYGTCSFDTKPVSESTARRWFKEMRTRRRRSKSLITSRPALPAPAMANNFATWAANNMIGRLANG
jgi:hypothetical protein